MIGLHSWALSLVARMSHIASPSPLQCYPNSTKYIGSHPLHMYIYLREKLGVYSIVIK